MLVSTREEIVDIFRRSATSDERRGFGARIRVRFEVAVGAACLAAAYFLPDGYPRLVAFALMSLCSLAWILRACQSE